MPAKPPDPYPATVDLPLQTRTDVRLMPESVDAERRTVEVVWSTERRGAPARSLDRQALRRGAVARGGHVDLSRLNGGAPLLNTHGAWDLRDVIGVVERAWIAREGEALVGRPRCASPTGPTSSRSGATSAGIVRNVSVGYAVRSYEITETDGQPPVWRAVDWQPLGSRRADRRRRRRRLPRAGQTDPAAEPVTHPCHLLRRTPAPIPEEPTMTREAETETTPPEAAAAAAPAAAPAEPTRRPGPRPRRRRPAPSRRRRSFRPRRSRRPQAWPTSPRRPSARGPRSHRSPPSTTRRASSASPARSPTTSSPAASASTPPAPR